MIVKGSKRFILAILLQERIQFLKGLWSEIHWALWSFSQAHEAMILKVYSSWRDSIFIPDSDYRHLACKNHLWTWFPLIFSSQCIKNNYRAVFSAWASLKASVKWIPGVERVHSRAVGVVKAFGLDPSFLAADEVGLPFLFSETR